ncbi:MAG: hypothetical protein AB8I08_05075 [Sandaracinaceae bacterium]
MRSQAAALASTIVLLACGAAHTPVTETVSEAVDDAGALQVLAIPRPTGGRVWLSRWVDAGPRHGAPGAAALAAAALSNSTIHGRALPDGVELQRTCEAENLAECLEGLAAAVGQREVPESARSRLRDARRRALPNLRRRADGLAVSALLGRDVDPLLGPEASAADATAFLAEHAGAGRILLIGVGDLERERFRDLARDAFDGVPAASGQRAERAPLQSAVEVDVDTQAHAAVAVAQPSVAQAAGLARRLLGRDRGTSAEVFPIRGGALTLLRGGTPEQLVHAAQLALSESPTEAPPPPPDSPLAVARAHGARWISRSSAGTPPVRAALGVGAVLAGGRGDDLQAEDPDRSPREAAQAQLRALLEPAAPSGAPSRNETEIAGVRLSIRDLPGAPDAAVVLRFEGGADEEPANAHGVTWMLASLAESGCSRVARDELGRPPEQLGLDVRAFIEPEAWGLALSGPRDLYRELIYLAVRCAEVPHRGRLEAARAEGVADAERHALAAAGARLLAPHCPGRVRPEGSAVGISAIHHASLERWRQRVATRSRLTAVFVGDTPTDAVVARFAQLLPRLPEGTAATPLDWPAPEAELTTLHQPEGINVWVAWDASAEGPSAEWVAGTFAEVVGRSLNREPGVRVESSEAGASAGRVWASVQLSVSEAALTALPQHLSRALSGLDWEGPIAARHEQIEEAESAAGASARGLALRVAAGRPSPTPRPEVARALAAATPRYVIAREQVGHR